MNEGILKPKIIKNLVSFNLKLQINEINAKILELIELVFFLAKICG